MLARLKSLKNKRLTLVNSLKEEVNEVMVKEIKKKKLQIKDTITRLVRKKSIHRKKRYNLRTKRLSRIGNFA